MRLVICIIAVSIPMVASAENYLQSISADGIHIIKISAQDRRAVIKTSVGDLQIIKIGDRIGTAGRVVEITRGRVVIEEMTPRGIETVVIRVENGKQTVERISNVAKDQRRFIAPQ